jgi:hypothetical protein
MTLEFSYLSEAFPEFTYTGMNAFLQQDSINEIVEELPPNYENKNELTKIKLNEKLRIDKNGNLQIDTRRFQCISRKLSGDNRWKILEKLKELNTSESCSVINVLINSTYSKDKKWIEQAEKLLIKNDYSRYSKV